MNIKTMNALWSVVLLVSMTALSLRAQNVATEASQTCNKLSAGIMLGGSFNMHRGILTTNEGILECGRFENANTLGWIGGNYANIPLSSDIALSVRLYYHKANATFTADNPVQPLIALGDGSTTALQTQHDLDVSLDYVNLDVLGQYFLSRNIYAAFGLSSGMAARNAFEQQESIIAPQGTNFLDGSTTRRIAAGYFTDEQGNRATNNVRIAGVAGVGAMLPLGSSFILNPELSFQYAFSRVISSADWKVHAVRGSIGVLYILESAPPPKPIIVPEPKQPEAPRVVMAPPVVSLEVNNVNSDGSVEGYAEVTIQNHRTMDILPLLPYVFFNASSLSLPERYHALTAETASSFRENQLSNDQLGVYYELLNIIGARMKLYPEAKLSLVGCIEPMDDGTANKSLASQRAAAVREYLRSVWGINDERISIRSRELPEIVSTRSVKDGRAENRRVEITASDPRILAPVYVRNAKTTITPNAIRLQPAIAYEGKLASVKHSILDNSGRVLGTTTSSDAQAKTLTSGELNLASLNSTQPLRAITELTTDDGKTARSERSIPVRRSFTSSRGNAEVVKDTVVERYSMILFNFDRSSTIASNNDQILSLIRSRIRTTSSVSIEGMTDYIGKAQNNQRLSEARANAVQNSIEAFIKPVDVQTKGSGEVKLFDNALPEGRFYNRRVFVEISTPLDPELDEEKP